ncbi:MFS transporter [Mesorhizobium sp.]|uniref:MFS transporter n=1 Tax=Mesorhizobium sp. TaxID=1871066 RepID=UPI00338F93A5
MAVASAMLTASVGLGFVHPWMILGFSFFIACGGALNDTAWQTSIPPGKPDWRYRGPTPCSRCRFNTVRTSASTRRHRGNLVRLLTALAVTPTYLVPPLQMEGSLSTSAA